MLLFRRYFNHHRSEIEYVAILHIKTEYLLCIIVVENLFYFSKDKFKFKIHIERLSKRRS